MPKLRRDILDALPRGVVRTCGFPACRAELRYDVFDEANGFGSPSYCEQHKGRLANSHRARLRDLISEIDKLLISEEPLPRRKRGRPAWTGITRRELEQWRARILWHLRGMPGSDGEFRETDRR
ncbi:hypothetical protein CFH99_24410 [Nocardioides aromaticivorans]|uniref:Uncharacterized protein n=2 Tax=Nocardioides aromaticivorans TaxID=200618 RepID=A0ABX7PRY4_9ACTN|nr:hypothetical protein CFH99_24410 [Nocardioides aromaticivorans]